ncbi:hypothetical protein CHS0354_034245, partial [Potamilus streckersoni]
MHGSLTWGILFSLTFMSHLYKEFSCKSIFHKTENGLEQKIAEKHLLEITEYMEQKRLKQQRPFHEVLNRDCMTNSDGSVVRIQSIQPKRFMLESFRKQTNIPGILYLIKTLTSVPLRKDG